VSNQGDGQGPENNGDGQQGEAGGQWTGGQQPWSGGQQPWATGGQDVQPPSWSTGETGPNVGPTMNNPQSSYYDRFSEASGEGLKVPQGGGGGRGKVLLGLAAALVLIIAGVAIFAVTRGDDSPKKAAGTSASSAALAPVKATTWVNPTLGVGARALKAGWVTQSSDSSALHGQYDVPKSKDWKVDSNSFALGYADANGTPTAMAGAVSEYKLGFCSADKKAQSAWVGIRGIGTSDPTEAGPKWTEKFVKGISVASKGGKDAKPGKVSDAKKVTVDQGTIPAVQYTATTEAGDQNKCDKGKKYEVRTINFSAGGKSYQLVTVRLLGVDDSLSSARLDEIISTFRPSS
jgi:hypothetical protein